MVLLALAAIFALAYVISTSRDARLLRNGVFLSAAVVFGVLGALVVLTPYTPIAGVLLVGIVLTIPLAVLVLAVALIRNGVTMMRREGRSLGNRLSLFAGIAVLALPVVSLALIALLGPPGLALAGLVAITSAYFGAAFVSFALYSVVYAHRRPRSEPGAVVVHGAGLANGQVTPLLRGRLDRGLEVYRKAEAEHGRAPLLVPSGGQGPDESRAEADAMAEYLRAQGVPEEHILPEVQSRTTRENLLRSTELLCDAGVEGPLVLVTSDYHVLRTASLARRCGVDAHVVGSRTAPYYVPSAFIREFVALIVINRWVTVAFLAPFAAMALALGVLLIRG